MTPAEINAAIAESLGWRSVGYISGYGVKYPGVNEKGEVAFTPDFYGSLDAIVPVNGALPDDDKESVMDWLKTKDSYPALATAGEWCEAYLRWKGLWK
jgi:hypothetical protein